MGALTLVCTFMHIKKMVICLSFMNINENCYFGNILIKYFIASFEPVKVKLFLTWSGAKFQAFKPSFMKVIWVTSEAAVIFNNPFVRNLVTFFRLMVVIVVYLELTKE